ncbi:hypothetical protein EVAR_97147_1 [Eumeta japonica]|uniref:Uncharacterized protein n=1 Tax=Eumeta variegata TaxID=151549 RepID=A0A4C1XQI2_EUMVA|nr:hypothetical protein EVAR_97147_1 [Eumeta japonica]
MEAGNGIGTVTDIEEAIESEGEVLAISLDIAKAFDGVLSSVQFRYHIERKVKLASKEPGALNRARQYFKPDHRLLIYKEHVRTHLKYSCLLWTGVRP